MKALFIIAAFTLGSLTVHAGNSNNEDCSKRAAMSRAAKQNNQLIVADALRDTSRKKNSQRRQKGNN